MSKLSRARSIEMPWRKVCTGLPVVALIGGGFAFTTLAGSKDVDSPAIVVPEVASALPAAPSAASTDPLTAAQAEAPGLMLPAGTVPGSSTPMILDSEGIPLRALSAYRKAASLVNSADPGCHIDWALPAAIGRVESDHARFAGNRLGPDGVARPGIIGISLDGSNGTARITDSDGGRLDRDSVYDRAVGPMQFIPSTWRVAGTDADGDKVKNPQDMADSATAAAIYLCSGPGDLRAPDDLRAAVMRYNASASYTRTVTAIAAAYRHGVAALPTSDLPSAGSSRSTTVAARPVTTPRRATPSSPAPKRSGSVPATAPRQQPAASALASPGSTPVPATPDPATPAPAMPDPATPDPATPHPAPPDTATPHPATPDPATPDPAIPDPATPHPATPDPATPDPATPDPTSCTPAVPGTALPGPALTRPPMSARAPVSRPSVLTRANPTAPVPAPLVLCPPTVTPPTAGPLDSSPTPPSTPRRHRGRH